MRIKQVISAYADDMSSWLHVELDSGDRVVLDLSPETSDSAGYARREHDAATPLLFDDAS